ncbi:MAG: alpha/beta hydrolase-fold protein [candidate division KSB1 bacterium]|nr:alpha/beta hydrolase-fold protein [candidate division KSB1 bacterium]
MVKQQKTILVGLLLATLFATGSWAQNWNRQPTPNDTLTSVRVLPDQRVILRIYAPQAAEVRVGGSDIPNMGSAAALTKRDDGVWETTLGPLPPGAYRYTFNVDGVSVLDPRSASISESNGMVWSLFYVPGAEFMDLKNVPHGAVAELVYYSTSLQRFRRLHVYTPPGYETGKEKYPIFYLLHGAMDCDDSWTTVGRAGIILDNLIAAGKAVPMVVVMPAGHTGPFRFGASAASSRDEFLEDFLKDIMPLVESRYRVYQEQKYRAVAGLSMGGAQTLNIIGEKLDQFGFIGVFSSGLFSLRPGQAGAEEWEKQHQAVLTNEQFKKGVRVMWFATGVDDFLLEVSRATVELMRKYGFEVTYKETAGGHTWSNWREYLNEFAQLLFK